MMQVDCLRLLGATGVVGPCHYGLWPLVHVTWELGLV